MYKTKQKSLKSISIIYSFKKCLIKTVTELKNKDIEKESLYHVDFDNTLTILRFQILEVVMA